MLSKFANSRKFWIAVIGFIVALTLFLRGQISANELVDAIIALTTVLTGAIAIEDGAQKFNARQE